MNWLIFPPQRQAELDAINAQFNDRACSPVITADGLLLIGADLLADGYWAAYHELLASLAPLDGEPVFPTLPPPQPAAEQPAPIDNPEPDPE